MVSFSRWEKLIAMSTERAVCSATWVGEEAFCSASDAGAAGSRRLEDFIKGRRNHPVCAAVPQPALPVLPPHSLVFFSEFLQESRGSETLVAPKKAGEIRRILKAERVADLRYAELRVGEHALGIQQAAAANEFARGVAGLL